MSTRSAIKSVKDAVAHVDVDEVSERAQHGWNRIKQYVPHLPQNISPDEQQLSLVGGAAIAGLGLTRLRRPSGWLALGLGAALIVRGATGSCGVYKALGVDTKHK